MTVEIYPPPTDLDRGLRYRFRDYVATVTAMNVSGRVALREQYQSAL